MKVSIICGSQALASLERQQATGHRDHFLRRNRLSKRTGCFLWEKALGGEGPFGLQRDSWRKIGIPYAQTCTQFEIVRISAAPIGVPGEKQRVKAAFAVIGRQLGKNKQIKEGFLTERMSGRLRGSEAGRRWLHASI
jgi:hypothetical protein